jgi:hypothetical protein
MPDDFPQFDSDDEMREWFDTVDLSELSLDKAFDVVIATRVQLSVGAEPGGFGSTTAGATGTLREPVRLVRG